MEEIKKKRDIAFYERKIQYNIYFITFFRYLIVIIMLTILGLPIAYLMMFPLALIELIVTFSNMYYRHKIKKLNNI